MTKKPGLGDLGLRPAAGPAALTAPAASAPAVSKIAAKGEQIAVTLRLRKEQWRRLKELSIDERSSIQALAIEGMSRLFVERGLPPL